MNRDFSYTKAYRQGEILIFKLPKRKKQTLSYDRLVPKADNVIREGEKTGHEHKLEGDVQLNLFKDKDDEGTIEVGPEGATVTHPEHADVKLEEGSYAFKVQKEATGKNRSSSVRD